MKPPLDGIIIPGYDPVSLRPFCTMLLGDMGAKVIKVEAAGGWGCIPGPGPRLSAGRGRTLSFDEQEQEELLPGHAS